ncbi:hypothetical protein E4V42_03880 [Clostridium estertheticum]|uniref:Transcription regulator PadR N-terminal domain-containing protein n=1 Tax=Clostridium estertheticum TaxID=238834 RepID=A0A5N7IJT4_9CLOT|nr:hypothetical protein [Clostridium estertheticum]MPQ61249.1 hypothetical protein [Clostridium estertheticum]
MTLIFNKEILKGSIYILLLALLSNNDSYGYQIAMQIKLKSRGDYEISEGTLYLALKRLETNEYVQSYLLIFNNS